jgi:hypothetical protein
VSHYLAELEVWSEFSDYHNPLEKNGDNYNKNQGEEVEEGIAGDSSQEEVKVRNIEIRG